MAEAGTIDERRAERGRPRDAGRDQAFDELVHRHGSVLLRTAYLLTGDRTRAEDLLQAALERTYRRWSRIDLQARPEAYVRRVLVNLATDWWRMRRWSEVPLEAVPDAALAGRDAYAGADARDEVLRALRALPRRQRAVVVLRYCEDRSEAEVAELLGCSTGTVKSSASRGLARLRELMAATPEELSR